MASKRKLRAFGWVAYCVDIKRGTGCHKGPWNGWIVPTKAGIEELIAISGKDVPFAKLVPARLYVEVPPKPKPEPKRCGGCDRPLPREVR